MRLSVLDQSPIAEGSTASEALAQTARLAQETEKLGYHRFWVSEHHFTISLAGSSPEVLISHLAAKTKKIRIGSGGVMLPHYSAYKVAENFRLLEALYPGRIDLGIGRAPGGMPLATMALQEGKTGTLDKYPEQLEDLIAYLHDTLGDSHRFAGLRATPVMDSAPQLWLLGSSGESARLAARTGAGFAFAQFINGYGGADEMRGYQRQFQPSVLGERPSSLLAVFVICGETEEEANDLASSLDLTLLLLEKGRSSQQGTPSIDKAKRYPYTPFDLSRIEDNRKRMIVGTPEQVKERMLRLAERYGTGEMMVVTITHDFEARLKSYRLLADAFQLPARELE
ncbi:Limonene 1,2-monooxygenase [Paenibacillus konkukensis]|uniref:Limonene 1,2-monooxygenase n=1 Tax=Paenibacillus konkukensis TaxID=2020716 RepID=A0ABY4RS28_9BACL|nr:LLM class flavin-dependent oxidoreductase [Paenibacillus konkukensis]UQZ84767.1 Limonene 1,2-monooxygenase [Paenibacillus konkukensis]